MSPEYSLKEKLISWPQTNDYSLLLQQKKVLGTISIKSLAHCFIRHLKQKDHISSGNPKISFGPRTFTVSLSMPVNLCHFSKLLTSGTYSTSIACFK